MEEYYKNITEHLLALETSLHQRRKRALQEVEYPFGLQNVSNNQIQPVSLHFPDIVMSKLIIRTEPVQL